MWIMTAPVISTAHISFETAQAFERSEDHPNLVGVLIERGYLFYVPESVENVELEDLKEVFNWAFANNYAYVRFDRDGDVVPGLATYDW